jgi:hypothetical protein
VESSRRCCIKALSAVGGTGLSRLARPPAHDPRSVTPEPADVEVVERPATRAGTRAGRGSLAQARTSANDAASAGAITCTSPKAIAR